MLMLDTVEIYFAESVKIFIVCIPTLRTELDPFTLTYDAS
jgi:hypothetical protein